jgi:signal transduction histidine kinase
VSESPAASRDQDVEARLTALLFRNATLSTLVNVAVSAAVALLGLIDQPGRIMLAWWLLMLGAALLRQRTARGYELACPDPAQAPAWRARYLRGTQLVGLLWLVGGSAVMWHNDVQYRLLAALAMVGLVAGAVPVLGMVRGAYRWYAVPLCLGIAVVTMLDGQDAAHWTFVAFVLVFLGAVLRSANFLHRTLVEAIGLEIDRGRMLGSLEQARADAESANIAKTQFLATMSHELRTPLTGLLGMAELLCEPQVSDDERKEFAQIILSSGRSLLALLNDILDLSKVEAGRLEIALADFQPAPLLEELAVLFTEPARAKGVQITARWEGPPQVQYVSDPIRVRQMVTNLVANAVKFTDHGSVRIEGRELRRAGAIAELEFAVEDTGLGIAPDKLALLFRPFSQVDNSNARRAGGTGLGLSIVRRLAQLMDGEAGVTSTPGQGSRFWVRIKATRLTP